MPVDAYDALETEPNPLILLFYHLITPGRISLVPGMNI